MQSGDGTNARIKVPEKHSIRNAGFNELWLQDQIAENPNIIGLGDLILLKREKKQSSGGKLDIQLKDPQDNSMYEIEIMLGDTDESHIIRAIEYWEIEKRRYPQRQHFAVLIAENITRRFFNVIQLLSLNIPIIAIQVELLKLNEDYFLNFTKVLDVYEEPEDIEETVEVTARDWNNSAKWTLDTANKFLSLIDSESNTVKLKYVKSYIAICDDNRNLFYFQRKGNPKSYLSFKVRNEDAVNKIKELFDSHDLSYNYNKYKEFILTIDNNFVEKQKDMFISIFKLMNSA